VENQDLNQIITLAALAVMTKAAYSLGEVYSPGDISRDHPREPDEGRGLEEFIARLKGSEKKHEVELAQMFPPERIEAIKRKELRRYKAAQDKKWENWLEGVSK
jgi:predicted anti-sigma-YlaC factor YlaD